MILLLFLIPILKRAQVADFLKALHQTLTNLSISKIDDFEFRLLAAAARTIGTISQCLPDFFQAEHLRLYLLIIIYS